MNYTVTEESWSNVAIQLPKTNKINAIVLIMKEIFIGFSKDCDSEK